MYKRQVQQQYCTAVSQNKTAAHSTYHTPHTTHLMIGCSASARRTKAAIVTTHDISVMFDEREGGEAYYSGEQKN